MDKIITGGSTSVGTEDKPEIDFADYDRGPDSKSESGMSLAETVDVPEVIATEELSEDSFSASGSFNLSEFWLSSFAKLLRVIPTPALLIDRYCSVVFANESCGKLGADLGPIQGRSLLGLLVGESDIIKVCEAVSEAFDSRKPQIVQAPLRTTSEPIWGRMHFQVARLKEERVVLVLIEDLTSEKKLEVFSRQQEERWRKTCDTLRHLRDQLKRCAPTQASLAASRNGNKAQCD
jgi:hypothetical protein